MKTFSRPGLYGIPEFAINAVEIFLRLYLLIFYTDTIGLNAELAAYALAIGVFWDALCDPLIGKLSDRSHKPRVWFLFLSFLPLLFFFWMLFHPMKGIGFWQSQEGKFLQLLFHYLCFNTALAFYTIPYMALASDLTQEKREETNSFIAWRLFLGNLGGLCGTILPGWLLSSGKNTASSASYFVLLSIPLLFFPLFFLRKKPQTVMTQNSSWKTLKKNPYFLLLLAAYVVANIGLAMNSSLALYFYRYALQLEEKHTQLILAVFMFVFSLCLIAWVKIAERFGKKKSLLWGATLLGFSVFAYALLPKGEYLYPMLLGIFTGVVIGSVILLDSLLIDSIDYGEIKSGQNEAGLYFGFWKMGAKLARALAIAATGKALIWIGFTPNQTQSESTISALKLLFGPGVGSFLLLAVLFSFVLPFNNETIVKIRRIVKRRREKLR